MYAQNNNTPSRKQLLQVPLFVLMFGGIFVGAMAVRAGTLNFLPFAFFGGGSKLELPASQNATVGTSFSVPITLSSDGASIVGIDMKLTYPIDKLKLTKITAATSLPTTLTYTPTFSSAMDIANQTGVLTLSAVAFDAVTSKITSPLTTKLPVTLATLTFSPIADGQAVVKWVFSSNATIDSNVVTAGTPEDDLSKVTDLSVTIAKIPATPAPTPVPTATPAPGEAQLSNGGFEDGLTDWQNSGAMIVTTAQSGTQAVKLTNTSGFVSQNIASLLKADQEYQFSVGVSIATKGTSWGVPTLRVSKYPDLGTNEYGEAKFNAAAVGWQKLTVKRTFSAAELASPVYLGVRNFGFDGEAIADDVQVGGTIVATPIPTPTPTPTSVPTPTPTPVPTPTPTPTPTPAPSAATLTVSGVITTQDGSSVSNKNWLGTGQNTSSSYTGFHFSNLAIPAGATITAAKLEVQFSSTQWIPMSFVLKAENAANAAAFSKNSLPGSRSLTSASISHSSNEKTTRDSWLTLDDSSALVQAVVGQSSWQSGNALNLIAKGNNEQQYGNKPIKAAKLTVEYKK